MRFKVVSDLHVNFSNIKVDTSDIDVLILAGDMSPYVEETADWIEKNVKDDVTVLYVPGNHEYENSNVFNYDKKIKDYLADMKNVKVLQNEKFEMDGVRFLGTTLWTDFAAFPEFGEREDVMKEARMSICDFQEVYGRNGLFTPAECSELHFIAKDFLKRELDVKFDGKTVVITHFLPSPRCISNKYKGSSLNPYFACNVESLMGESVDLWVHGHTHESVDIKIGATRVLCNPRGYSNVFNMSENMNWNDNLTLEKENMNVEGKNMLERAISFRSKIAFGLK